MKNYKHFYFFYILLVICCFFLSCKNRELNYINYYNKVYSIDSTHRVNKDTLNTIRQYKSLFRKYPPVQHERIQEYATYIIFSDKYHKNFGGKKSLYKLLSMIAPYKNEYKEFNWLFRKYGIDSTKVKHQVNQWKKGLNQILVDSFTIAFKRDQHNRDVKEIVEMNDKKNAQLLLWTIKKYGYPSLQKIGLFGNDGRLMSMGTMLNHMAYTSYYEHFKTKLQEYVRSGECTPRDYTEMIDKYQYVNNKATLYGIFMRYDESNLNASDSARIDKNRTAIGFPRMKESVKIAKDFFDKLKKQK